MNYQKEIEGTKYTTYAEMEKQGFDFEAHNAAQYYAPKSKEQLIEEWLQQRALELGLALNGDKAHKDLKRTLKASHEARMAYFRELYEDVESLVEYEAS